MKRMMEVRQEVRSEVPLLEHGIPFNVDIIAEELIAHFRLPSHLPAYNGSTNPAKHIHEFENAALLHRYNDGIKYRVFLTTRRGRTLQQGELGGGAESRSFLPL
ncbi:UNVERIFIED_CONTAM: hypothetical protein Slati_1019600 [Sesamum latifolium]|uniref:Uncharacterized protein n=1 Tax=Sesamum latifolium TaxID=2727402 RepID=A0AAW2XS92_9LAMI